MGTKTARGVETVSIPARPHLEERLRRAIAETKRLRLLIRTAKDLEQIERDSTLPKQEEKCDA